MRGFVALLRREMWEHKVFRGLPLALLVVVLLVNLLMMSIDPFSAVSITLDSEDEATSLANLRQTFAALPVIQQSLVVNGTLIVIGMVINAVLMIMAAFYLLDALYADRKDQSILFWKSLPISDTRTVLSKLVIAVVVIPLLVLMTGMAAGLTTLAIQAWSLGQVSGAASVVWERADLVALWGLTALVLVQQAIWFFPVTGWLLLCSAWSMKTPIVVAVVAPMLIIYVDGLLGGRTGVGEAILERLPFGILSVDIDQANGLLRYSSEAGGFRFGLTLDGGEVRLNAEAARNLAASIEVWGGLLVGAAFVWMAIWLRRWRDDSL